MNTDITRAAAEGEMPAGPPAFRHFHEQLRDLKQLLLEMSERAESLVELAVDALLHRDDAKAEAVIIGRSMIVGKPLALLLVSKHSNATVTIAHSRSRDLPAICRRADILIAAVGRPEIVKASWIKPGAVVIDVGINRLPDVSKKSGYRLTGDVAYDEVAPLCAAITPVPGGVGPMTIAMLMQNTLQAARQPES